MGSCITQDSAILNGDDLAFLQKPPCFSRQRHTGQERQLLRFCGALEMHSGMRQGDSHTR